MRFALVVCRSTGASWRLVIASPPWTARYSFPCVIDAAGAIYILGGYASTGASSGNIYYNNDVYVSTDGGADRTQAVLRRVLAGGLLMGVGYLRRSQGYVRVL
jgi:hypothetical protein